MRRVCTFADGHTQHEAILDYSPAARSYRYTIDGGLPVADNRGRFLVEPAGNGARIVWESSFSALDPAAEAELSRRWVGMLPTVLGNLKTLIEQR
jgi:Polyketide cyclase / dehydrase and lipid transport